MAKTRRRKKQETKAAALKVATRSLASSIQPCGQIKFGDDVIGQIKYGNIDIAKVYIGNIQIYSKDDVTQQQENSQQEIDQQDSNSSNTIPSDIVIAPQN